LNRTVVYFIYLSDALIQRKISNTDGGATIANEHRKLPVETVRQYNEQRVQKQEGDEREQSR